MNEHFIGLVLLIRNDNNSRIIMYKILNFTPDAPYNIETLRGEIYSFQFKIVYFQHDIIFAHDVVKRERADDRAYCGLVPYHIY